MHAKRRRAALAAILLTTGAAFAAEPVKPKDRTACLSSVTADSLLRAPSDPELYDYAACSELVTGRAGLCDGFPGGPSADSKPSRDQEVVRADGSVGRETVYGVCVSRAAAYRFLSLLVQGAPDAELRPQMSLMLYGEKLSVDEVLPTYTGAYRRRTLEGLARPDLARVGFFNHVLGAKACGGIRLSGLRRECYKKAATLEALRAKDPARCQTGDFLCRALLSGPGVCQEIGARIVRRFCDRKPDLPPVKLTPAPRV